MDSIKDSMTTPECSFIIPIGISTFGRWMSPREMLVLHICKQDIRCNIDPIPVASTLRRYNRLTQSVYSSIMDMFRQGMSRESITDILISHIPYSTNLVHFVQALDECGYRKIATQLFLKFMTGGISCVQKSTSGQRPVVYKLYSNLKRMVHDAQFKNRQLAISQLANMFMDKMQHETDPDRKQLLADKCIATLGVEVDTIAISFDERLHEHDVFTQIKQLVSETSNTSLTEIGYLCRLANAYSITGNFQNNEEMLTGALCEAYKTGLCLVHVNMLYIIVYIKLWEFEAHPTVELRKQLMMWARTGIESLENEEDDTKTLWRRMFILRMVFCLLGIGNRTNIIEHCPIDNGCLSQAKDLLRDIDYTWYGIETRRKMFYFVAKARLNELTNNITECIEYIKVARELAHEGEFVEPVFIAEYYETIIPQIENHAARQMSTEIYQMQNSPLLTRETDDSSIAEHTGCMVNPDQGSQHIPAPCFGQKQATDHALNVMQTTPGSDVRVRDRDVKISPCQRLDNQLKESIVDYSGSNELGTMSNFDLIPQSAYHGLPRYFMVQPDEQSYENTIKHMHVDRSEPSGCSDDTLQVLPNQTNSRIYKEYTDEDSVVDQEKPDVQAWSFESDDMFGD